MKNKLLIIQIMLLIIITTVRPLYAPDLNDQTDNVYTQDKTYHPKTTPISSTNRFQSYIKSMVANLTAILQIQKRKKQKEVVKDQTISENSVPIIFYSALDKNIKLVRAENNQLITNDSAHNYFHNVNSYILSPQKRYLIINTTSAASIITRFTSRWLGNQISTAQVTKLIDTRTGKEITSFTGKKITIQFSPDEATLIIAGPQKSLGEKIGWVKPSQIGAHPSGDRFQPDTGEILRYELFDIASQKILKTFENIQAINFTAEDKLLVEYDNKTQQQIIIDRNAPLSSFRHVMNLVNAQPNITVKEEDLIVHQSIPLKIAYYYNGENNVLKIGIGNKEPQRFSNPLCYDLSRYKKFLLIKQVKETTKAAISNVIGSASGNLIPTDTITTLLDTTTGEILASFDNLITYELNPDFHEPNILVLSSQAKSVFGLEYGSLSSAYRLYGTTTKNNELKSFDTTTTQSVYFKSPVELIVVNTHGEQVPYDPQTGKSFEEIETEKTLFQEQEKEKSIQENPAKKESLLNWASSWLKSTMQSAKEQIQKRVEPENEKGKSNDEMDENKQAPSELQEQEKDKQITTQRLTEQKQQEEKRKAIREAEQRQEQLNKEEQEYLNYYNEPIQENPNEEESLWNWTKSWWQPVTQPTEEQIQKEWREQRLEENDSDDNNNDDDSDTEYFSEEETDDDSDTEYFSK